MINRLLVIEVQGIFARDKNHFIQGRSSAIRYLLQGLLGLIRTANTIESRNDIQDLKPVTTSRKARESISRRTKVPPDIWQDTLSLLCDSDSTVRNECSTALIYYIIEEIDRKSTRLNSSHALTSRMPSSA